MDTKSPTLEELQLREKQSLLSVYARFPVAFVRGSGRHLWDTTGKRYLDLAGGIAVTSIGHAHPRITEALTKQAETLIHVSNLYYTEPGIRLAERLLKYFGAGRCFFANSGAEANDGLYKLARRSGQQSGRYEVITAVNSFHGRTLAGIAATGQEKIKAGFAPIIPGFPHIPFNDLAAFESAITPQTAAILIEGIQGEGGITPATPEFLLGLRKLCDSRGLLLMMDAVQCGHFRTGRFQSFERILEGVPGGVSFKPDAISFAKSVGGGFPFGGFWVREPHIELLGPGSHGTTFGATPLGSAVANAVLDVIEEEKLQDNARNTGGELEQGLRNLIARFPGLLSAVRGYGLILGLELRADAPGFKDEKLTPAQIMILRLLKNGLLAVPSGATVIRFLPALNVTPSEVGEGIELLGSVLEEFA